MWRPSTSQRSVSASAVDASRWCLVAVVAQGVSHVTTHVSVREACDRITQERVLATIRLTHDALQRMGLSGPIAVGGLNPHAGESGLFGEEDARAIALKHDR